MNVVGAVTAAAAGLAAILSGINLYLSGRRELDKWTRETLIEVFVLFLDANFKLSSACRTILKSPPPPEQERNRLRRVILESHDRENEALTHLRLLAPPRAVQDARTLLASEWELVEPCFEEPLTIGNSDGLAKPVQQGRARFLESHDQR